MSALFGCSVLSCVLENARLCCWMLQLILLLTETVVLRLISLDVAGMMYSSFIHSLVPGGETLLLKCRWSQVSAGHLA